MIVTRVFVCLCLLTVAFINVSDSAKILGIVPMLAYSHHILGNKLLKGLAKQGHEITVITGFPEKSPPKNWRDIDISDGFKELEAIKVNLFQESNKYTIVKIPYLDMMGLYFAETFMNHTNVQKLLKSNEKFDLVILENFLNDAHKGFAYHFKAPLIMLSTIGSSRWTNDQVGNPASPSYVPDMYLSFSSDMTFCERVQNSLTYIYGELFKHLYTFPRQNEILQKYFPGAPHLSELHYNISLMLLNSHVSTNQPVPHVPQMVEIGGFHVEPPKKLDKDLQEFLDNAKDGAIFFSMGSNLKSKGMPVETIQAILRVFSKLKQKVLWKWEDDVLPGQPPNVKLGKWLPQQDILAHPNLKLFISHGGLLSTIETIYHGVPILGIPVFGDQETNVANAVRSGFALGLPYRDLTEEKFASALHELLTNPKYGENAKTRSKIMHDQPQKPLERAVYWVEYVLRHKGAYHLRSSALDLAWYQYLLLDVVAFLGVITLVSLAITFLVVRKLFCSFFCKKKQAKKTAQSKKKNQ